MSELDKMSAARVDAAIISEFIDFLEENGYAICEVELHDQWWPVRKSYEQLLADYFEIDLKKVEEERRALLEELRKAQG